MLQEKYNVTEAAADLHVSKSTMSRLIELELEINKDGISKTYIGAKRIKPIIVIFEPALRRIENRMLGGYYSKKEPARATTPTGSLKLKMA